MTMTILDYPQLEAARRLDLAGNLHGAHEHVVGHLRGSGRGQDSRRRSAAFRLQARILRHGEDPADLRMARDSASHAVRLANLAASAPGERSVGLAELELAACLLSSDRHIQALGMAKGWLGHPDATVSGWAWALVGECHLETSRFFVAVADLQNALAEFARAGKQVRERSVRITLADALTRCGRLGDAASVLEQDRGYWSQPAAPTRIRIRYLLARAGNLHQLGRIAEALDNLEDAQALLGTCTGMDAVKVRLDQQFAACLTEWGQLDRAEGRRKKANGRLDRLAPRFDGPREPPPPPSAPIAVDLGREHRTPDERRVNQDLVHSDEQLQARLARRLRDKATLSQRRLSAAALGSQVDLAINEAKGSPKALTPRVAGQVARLHGVPGLERVEVGALVEAGALLRGLGTTSLLESQRLLRRAVERVRFLDGMELWEARALLELGRTLDAMGESDRALECVLGGAGALHLERFAMRKRAFRDAWLRTELHPAFELGVRLALERNLPEVASEIIVFSRTAGFVASGAPDIAGGDRTDLPFLPVPRTGDPDDLPFDIQGHTNRAEHRSGPSDRTPTQGIHYAI